MKKIGLIILAVVSFAACDLQPKIVSLPDTVGDFISSRYPALLADPNTESDIYNSAARDYGVYASPELYGSVDMGDYVNYAGVDDYVLPDDDTVETVTDESEETDEQEVSDESTTDDAKDTAPEVEDTEPNEPDNVTDEEETDVLDIPEYQTDEINVPVRAAAGTVVVRRGDTLYAIARENNMTLDEIARANNLSAPYTIRIGQTLKVKSETPSKPEVKDTSKVEKDVVKETVKQPVKEPETPKQETKAPEKPKAQKAQTQKTEKPVQKVETKLEPKVQKEVRVPIKDIKVARGDTLYSISREYSVPVNDLAVMNGLSAPFALNVGQTLHVPDLQVHKAEATKKSAPTTTKVADKKSEPKQVTPKQNATTKKETKTTKTEPAKKAESVKKTDTKKAETKKVEPKKQDVKKVEKTDSKKTAQNKTAPKATSKTDTPKIAARSSSKFSWPVRGTVLSHYGAKTGGLYNDGINISAALNTAVVAAENGVVAYAGNEVRGMGNLVIIQHADGWMTVYAHMNSMTVRRGARVSVGQKIGTVGKTGKVTSPQLHFEIRKGTKAYNPVNYLKK